MDSNCDSARFAPPTPVSPDTSMLDYHSNGRHAHRQTQCGGMQLPMSPQSMCSLDLKVKDGRGGSVDSNSFENAMAEIARDRKAFSVVESKSKQPHGVSRVKSQLKKLSPSPMSTKVKSRDNKVCNQATMRPPALCATHPAHYYGKQRPDYKRSMLPTPPPVEHHDLKPRSFAKPAPLPPWRTYTDPNRQISGEPQFDDPKFRMLKMDVNPHQPKVLSPTFMIGLPCGSMVEAANEYPDARLAQSRDVSKA